MSEGYTIAEAVLTWAEGAIDVKVVHSGGLFRAGRRWALAFTKDGDGRHIAEIEGDRFVRYRLTMPDLLAWALCLDGDLTIDVGQCSACTAPPPKRRRGFPPGTWVSMVPPYSDTNGLGPHIGRVVARRRGAYVVRWFTGKFTKTCVLGLKPGQTRARAIDQFNYAAEHEIAEAMAVCPDCHGCRCTRLEGAALVLESLPEQALCRSARGRNYAIPDDWCDVRGDPTRPVATAKRAGGVLVWVRSGDPSARDSLTVLIDRLLTEGHPASDWLALWHHGKAAVADPTAAIRHLHRNARAA